MVSSSFRKINNFRADEYKYEIKFRTIDGAFDRQNERVFQLFNQLEQFVQSKAKENDHVRVVLDHQDLHYPISTNLVRIHQFDINNLLNSIENVCQSHRTLSIDEHLIVYIVVVKIPTGSCIRNSSNKIASQYIANNKCLKQIVNKDNHCALRSIIIAIAFHKDSKESKHVKEKLCKINSTILQTRINEVVEKLKLKNEPRSIDDLRVFELYFMYYRIVVYDEIGTCIREGDTCLDKNIYLFLEDGHYSPITNIKAFFGTRYFCEHCQKTFQNMNSHRTCPIRCNACNEYTCVKTDNKKCDSCDMQVANDKCLEIHLQSFCRVANKCDTCGIFKLKNHVCIDQKHCVNCNHVVHKAYHKCFVLTEEEKKERLKERKEFRKKKMDEKKKLAEKDKTAENFEDDCVEDMDVEFEEEKPKKIRGYIFFDYEATQENKFHTPNLVCALQLCLTCADSCNLENINCPKNCGERIFLNNDSFCSWLFQQKNYTAIAHNMKGNKFYIKIFNFYNNLIHLNY